MKKEEAALFGLMVEFLAPEDVLSATRAARQAGYRDVDAYTPYTVEGLATELGMRKTRIPSVVLIGGLVGAGFGFFMQYYAMAISYPLNVGGRPYNSWPSFIPIAFEVMVLVASLAAVFAFLYLNGLPQPHHPVFYVPQFERASQDRFFLCIEATDPQFDRIATEQFLAGLNPHGGVLEVPMRHAAKEVVPAEAEREEHLG